MLTARQITDRDHEYQAHLDQIKVVQELRILTECMANAYEHTVMDMALPGKLKLRLMDLLDDFRISALDDEIDPEIRCLEGELQDIDHGLYVSARS